MFHKRIGCALLSATLIGSAAAGNFYLGPTFYLQYNSAAHSNFIGWHPQIELGYHAKSEKFYLAGEIFEGPGTINVRENHNGTTVGAKSTQSFGVSILPGVRVNEQTVAYARLGAANTHFTGPNESRNGGLVGFGLQSYFAEGWDIRGEYVFTAYSSMPRLGSVKSHQVGVGAIYNFGT